MLTIVKKNGEVLSTDNKDLTKEELQRLNRYLKSIQKRQHLCFDCGKDIAECIKIMDVKERLDETNKYDFITEAYQEINETYDDMKKFIVTGCDDFIKPGYKEIKGPTTEQKKQLKISYVNHLKGNREDTDYVTTYEEACDVIDHNAQLAYKQALENGLSLDRTPIALRAPNSKKRTGK